MTDDSATPTPTEVSGPDSQPAAAAPWKRYAVIVGVLVVLLAVGWIVLGDRIAVDLHISGLHSNEGRTRAAHVTALKEHPEKDLVIERLLDAVVDEDNAFEVRKICADLLHRHFNRLQKLEGLLRSGASLHTRGVVLRSLMVEPYFLDEIANEPAFRVRETIDEWLRNAGDLTRAGAIQLAVTTDHREAMPLIRALLKRSGAPSVQVRQERNVMIAAAGAAERFGDCEVPAELLPIAASDADLLVRLRFMQIADRMVFGRGPGAVCPDGLTAETMAAHVRGALDDEAHEVRMGAMLILVRHPEWAEPAAARLREIVAGGGSGAERRHALEALLRIGKPDDIARIPEYCHDRSHEVRITAIRQIKVNKDTGFEGCWIGVLEDETDNESVWLDALDFLYKFEKVVNGRVGFPPQMSAKSVNAKASWKADLEEIYRGGEIAVAEPNGAFKKITRTSVAEDHFKWWFKSLEGDEDRDALDKAVAARKAFYEAKQRGDAKAAQAALDGAPQAVGLWSYEKAWLAIEARR